MIVKGYIRGAKNNAFVEGKVSVSGLLFHPVASRKASQGTTSSPD
jgi:hypothetical protein